KRSACCIYCYELDDLKDLCRVKGLSITGKKGELVGRLLSTGDSSANTSGAVIYNISIGGSHTQVATHAAKAPSTTKSTPVYEAMNLDQLRQACREKGLQVGGRKDQLLARLHAGQNVPAGPSTATNKRDAAGDFSRVGPAKKIRTDSVESAGGVARGASGVSGYQGNGMDRYSLIESPHKHSPIDRRAYGSNSATDWRDESRAAY
ncbi:hypothetical protein SARC_13639, partial [Sphaeroforma arctica JP610]